MTTLRPPEDMGPVRIDERSSITLRMAYGIGAALVGALLMYAAFGARLSAVEKSDQLQDSSLADTKRAIQMYRKLNIPAIGLIENMSHFVCPGCGRDSDIFGKGGGERLAAEMSVPFLGHIPLYEPVRQASDNGVPVVISDPQSPPAVAIMAAAERVAQQVSIASFARRAMPLHAV